MTVGLLTTSIFSDFAGYVFRNFRDKASIITQQYTVLRRLSADPKVHELE